MDSKTTLAAKKRPSASMEGCSEGIALRHGGLDCHQYSESPHIHLKRTEHVR